MKVKRYKHAKKVLSFYKNTFKIREPYQVIGKHPTLYLCGSNMPWSRCSGRDVLSGGAKREDSDKGAATQVPGRPYPARYCLSLRTQWDLFIKDMLGSRRLFFLYAEVSSFRGLQISTGLKPVSFIWSVLHYIYMDFCLMLVCLFYVETWIRHVFQCVHELYTYKWKQRPTPTLCVSFLCPLPLPPSRTHTHTSQWLPSVW